jgi:phenylacetyl-CoA:acceptor oxidoreductase subunit 2
MRVRPWHQTPWDWRAGIQFSCGGTGTGLLLFTAVASFQDVHWLTYTGWLSLLIIGIGLLSVWVKLGQRWRALYVILNPRTSWMSREALLSLPLLGFGLVGLWLQSPPLTLTAALFGVGFLFAQAQMLKASRGIPAWREPLLVPLILVTGWVEGAGLLLVTTAVFGDVGLWLPVSLFVLLLLRLWLWTTYRSKLAQPGAAPLATVAALDKIHNTEVWLGNIVPLVILLIVPLAPSLAAVAAVVAGLLALLPGWLMKYTIITKAAFNQGFALTRTPARTPGYSGPGTKPGW